MGLSRAILLISDDFKSALRADGLLTQDRREKERKKYGKRGARKSPQIKKTIKAIHFEFVLTIKCRPRD